MNHCEVTTKHGSLRVERRKGVPTFRGIPYATPPYITPASATLAATPAAVAISAPARV